MSKNFSGKFYLFYRIYDTEILSTKLPVRLFGVDSLLYAKYLHFKQIKFAYNVNIFYICRVNKKRQS